MQSEALQDFVSAHNLRQLERRRSAKLGQLFESLLSLVSRAKQNTELRFVPLHLGIAVNHFADNVTDCGADG